MICFILCACVPSCLVLNPLLVMLILCYCLVLLVITAAVNCTVILQGLCLLHKNMSCLRSARDKWTVTRRGRAFSLATSADFGARSFPPFFTSALVVVFFSVYIAMSGFSFRRQAF